MSKNIVTFVIVLIVFAVAPLYADDVMAETKESMKVYLAQSLDGELTNGELIAFGDAVYSWDPAHYNAALHIIAWYVEQEESREKNAMLALAAYLQGKWQAEKLTRRMKLVRVCFKGGFGVAKHVVVGFFVGTVVGAQVGLFGGAMAGAAYGAVSGLVVGHLRTWKKISPEIRATVRLKPSKIINPTENDELVEILDRGITFYEETKELITYSVNDEAPSALSEEVDFLGLDLIGI